MKSFRDTAERLWQLRDRKRQVGSMCKTKGEKNITKKGKNFVFFSKTWFMQQLIYLFFFFFLIKSEKPVIYPWKKYGVIVWLIAHTDVRRCLIMHQYLPHYVEEHHHSRLVDEQRMVSFLIINYHASKYVT